MCIHIDSVIPWLCNGRHTMISWSVTYLECTVSNHVPSISGKGWSKALNQCTIQWGGYSATQCWWEGRSTCSKTSHIPSCEGCALSTSRCGTCYTMCQNTLTDPTHSPDGDSTPVSSNSTSEGEGITRTGGGSCSELPSNITWREKCMEII